MRRLDDEGALTVRAGPGERRRAHRLADQNRGRVVYAVTRRGDVRYQIVVRPSGRVWAWIYDGRFPRSDDYRRNHSLRRDLGLRLSPGGAQ